MKTLILFLFLSSFCLPQDLLIFTSDSYSNYYIDANGTNEYGAKTTPAGLIFNSQTEMITASNDYTFESGTIGNWTDEGNHTISANNTTPKAGTWCLQIVASAAGDATTNYIQLAASNFATLEVGKSYTVNVFGRAVSTSEIAVIKIGSKQVTTQSYSTSAYTLYALNFTATASELSQGLRIYMTSAGTLLIDDLSITEAYPTTILMWVRHSVFDASNEYYMASATGFGGTTATWRLYKTTAHKISFNPYPQGLTGYEATTTAAINDSTWYLIAIHFDRTSTTSTKVFILSASATVEESFNLSLVGSVNYINTFNICRNAAAGSVQMFEGFMGEVQIIRNQTFTQESLEQIRRAGEVGKSLPSSYSTGTIMSWYKWEGVNDAEMLNDHGSNNNDLTGTNLTTADQVKTNGYK